MEFKLDWTQVNRLRYESNVYYNIAVDIDKQIRVLSLSFAGDEEVEPARMDDNIEGYFERTGKIVLLGGDGRRYEAYYKECGGYDSMEVNHNLGLLFKDTDAERPSRFFIVKTTAFHHDKDGMCEIVGGESLCVSSDPMYYELTPGALYIETDEGIRPDDNVIVPNSIQYVITVKEITEEEFFDHSELIQQYVSLADEI